VVREHGFALQGETRDRPSIVRRRADRSCGGVLIAW